MGEYAAPLELAVTFATGLLQRCRAYGAGARRARKDEKAELAGR